MIAQQQLRFVINRYVRDVMVGQGRLPTPTEIEEFLSRFGSHDFGTPLLNVRPVSKGLVSSPENFNATFTEVGQDLEILFESARRQGLDILSTFSHSAVALQALKNGARNARRDIETILLVSDKSSGLMDAIREDFSDMERVDTIQTTAEVDVKRRVCRLAGKNATRKHFFGQAEEVVVTVQAEHTLEGKGVSAVNFELANGSSGPITIVNDLLNDFYCPVVRKTTDAPVDWRVTVEFPQELDLTRVQLDLSTAKTVKASLTIFDKDENSTFKGSHVTQESVEWQFGLSRVKKVSFFIRSHYTNIEDSIYFFYLLLRNISVFTDSFQDSSNMYTEEMPLEFSNKVGRLSLQADYDGKIDFFVKVKYSDGVVSSFLPITPVDDVTSGDTVVLGNITDNARQEQLLTYNTTTQLTQTQEIEADVVSGSVQVATGVDLVRFDYNDSYIKKPANTGEDTNTEYVAYHVSPQGLDPEIANTAFYDAAALSTAVGGINLPTFHRYKISFVVWKEADSIDKEYLVVTTDFSGGVSGVVGAGHYVGPVISVYNTRMAGNQVEGIDSSQTVLEGGSGEVELSLREGANYFTISLDTGIRYTGFNNSVYDDLKDKTINLKLDRRVDSTTSNLLSFASEDLDFFVGGADDFVDVQIYRRPVSLYRLQNALHPDYDHYAIEDIQTGSVSSFSINVNHRFGKMPTDIGSGDGLGLPTEDVTNPKCLLSYKEAEREIESVWLWARLKNGEEIPVLRNYELRFAI